MGPAGEDDPAIAGSTNLFRRELIVILDFREHMQRTDAAGDELIILPTEIQNENLIHQFSILHSQFLRQHRTNAAARLA